MSGALLPGEALADELEGGGGVGSEDDVVGLVVRVEERQGGRPRRLHPYLRGGVHGTNKYRLFSTGGTFKGVDPRSQAQDPNAGFYGNREKLQKEESTPSD